MRAFGWGPRRREDLGEAGGGPRRGPGKRLGEPSPSTGRPPHADCWLGLRPEYGLARGLEETTDGGMGARAEAPALQVEVLLPEQRRERPSSDTAAQNWRWASDGPKAEAREAKTSPHLLETPAFPTQVIKFISIFLFQLL